MVGHGKGSHLLSPCKAATQKGFLSMIDVWCEFVVRDGEL